MTSTPPPDIEEVLRGLPTPSLSSDARQRHLAMLAELASAPSPRRRWSRWRKFTITGLSVLLAGGIGVGAAAALGVFSEPPPDRSTAHCFTTDDLHDRTNHEDFMVANKGSAIRETDAASKAMEICAGGWQQGRYSATDPKILLDPKPGPANSPVPPLVACVLRNGQVGVFPGDEQTCHKLGLPVAEI